MRWTVVQNITCYYRCKPQPLIQQVASLRKEQFRSSITPSFGTPKVPRATAKLYIVTEFEKELVSR